MKKTDPLTFEIEALRQELCCLIQAPSDLTRQDVLRISRHLDVLLLKAQELQDSPQMKLKVR